MLEAYHFFPIYVNRQSKSERAGLTLRVGRMHQWMCLVKVSKVFEGVSIISTKQIKLTSLYANGFKVLIKVFFI